MADMQYVVPADGVVTWVFGPGKRPVQLTAEGARIDVSTQHARMLIKDGSIRLRDAEPASPPTKKHRRVKPEAEETHGD